MSIKVDGDIPTEFVIDEIARTTAIVLGENAALKEENKRLRDLLGKTSACISYMNRDVQGVAEEYLGFWPDDIQAEAEALLKEE